MILGDARDLALKLMAEHGIADWGFSFDRAMRRAGNCKYGRPGSLSLSKYLTGMWPEPAVRDTILHEITHAVVYLRYGSGHHHDSTWRRTAQKLGADPTPCWAGELPSVRTPWIGTCPNGHTLTRHKRPIQVRTCGQCSSRFDFAYVVTWRYFGKIVPLGARYDREYRTLARRAGR